MAIMTGPIIPPTVLKWFTNAFPASQQDNEFNDIKYTRSLDSSGWLNIKIEPSGNLVTIPEYTKIIIQRESNGRIFFLVKEGQYANRTASLKKENASKCLITANRSNGAIINVKIIGRKPEISKIRIVQDKGKPLNQLWADLSYNGKTIKITLDSDVYFEEIDPITHRPTGRVPHSSPLAKGTYKICIPDYVHQQGTERYRNHELGNKNLKYDTVWFPIEDPKSNNSKFIHVGQLSEGCVTIYDIFAWNDLYKYLISNRSDEKGLYIGEITIS